MNSRGATVVHRLTADPVWRALRALNPPRRRIALATLAGTAALASAIGLMATSAWLISRAAQQPLIGVLSVAIVTTRALGIARGALRYCERLVSHDVALRGVAALRERLYLRLVAADPALVAGLKRGDLLARVGADVDTLADLVVRSVLPFTTAAVTSSLTVVLIAVVLPGAAAALATGLILACAVSPWLVARSARRAELEAAAARSAMSAEVQALLDGLPELMVGRAVSRSLARLDSTEADLAERTDAAARPAGAAAALATAAMGAAMLASLALGVAAVRDGSMPEVMLAVVTLTPMAAAEIALALPAAAAALVRARAAATRVLELLEAPPAHAVAGAPGQDVDPARTISEPVLSARGLTCGWPGGPATVSSVDLDLPPGRHVALVGPSGSGKTTLLLTLAGLLAPLRGEVLLGGRDLRAVPLHEVPSPLLRRTVSFTAEDAHIFTTTVRENLRVARPDATDADLVAVLSRAGLSDWLERLPAHLDTMLEAGGADVSGGERRRLLLARAFLVGADVMLLDEMNEHLDPATADALVRDSLRAEQTVVVVTHRLSALEDADEVIVVAEGRFVARGTHSSLLDSNEVYRDAWRGEQAGRQDESWGSRQAPRT